MVVAVVAVVMAAERGTCWILVLAVVEMGSRRSQAQVAVVVVVA